jgi:hypothetical protein
MPFKIGHLTNASQETYSRHIQDLPEAVRQRFFAETFTCLEFCNQYTTLCRRKYMPLEINVLSVKTFCPKCKTPVSKLLIFPCNHALCSGCIVDYNSHIRYYRMLQRHRDMFWNRHVMNHHEWERRRGDHYVWHRISPHHEWQRIEDNDEDREEDNDEDREEDSEEVNDEVREEVRDETPDEDREEDREEVREEDHADDRDETREEDRDEDRGD